jgi:PhoH-like ATPase
MATTRFAEHEVVLPLVVISELEGKRNHPELGWFAREALRLLDDLRLRHGRLDSPVPIGDVGGTLHVELNHTDPEVLPAGFRTDSNDARILACALNLAAEGRSITLVTKDMTGQQIKNALDNAITSVLLGQKNPKQALKDAQNVAINAWNQTKH